jgi:hypothetical protein
MKAIVQRVYGPADVLEFSDINAPLPGELDYEPALCYARNRACREPLRSTWDVPRTKGSTS